MVLRSRLLNFHCKTVSVSVNSQTLTGKNVKLASGSWARARYSPLAYFALINFWNKNRDCLQRNCPPNSHAVDEEMIHIVGWGDFAGMRLFGPLVTNSRQTDSCFDLFVSRHSARRIARAQAGFHKNIDIELVIARVIIPSFIAPREQRWRSGESTRLPPMHGPGSNLGPGVIMRVELVVGSHPCSESFPPGIYLCCYVPNFIPCCNFSFSGKH